MYKHLIFDFGGVFLDLSGRHVRTADNLARVFSIPEEKAAAFWNANNEGLATGKETSARFIRRMNKGLGMRINTRKAASEWSRYQRRGISKSMIDWKLVSYVKKLKKDYKVHMLSNTTGVGWRSDKWLRALDSNFDSIFRSHMVGMRKPNKDIFLHALKKIGAKPEECIFVDDLQVNVNAANSIGIKGVLFTTFSKLKKDFSALGILVRD
jgi:epoxide hydrolase-like predicted phosphatase